MMHSGPIIMTSYFVSFSVADTNCWSDGYRAFNVEAFMEAKLVRVHVYQD